MSLKINQVIISCFGGLRWSGHNTRGPSMVKKDGKHRSKGSDGREFHRRTHSDI